MIFRSLDTAKRLNVAPTRATNDLSEFSFPYCQRKQILFALTVWGTRQSGSQWDVVSVGHPQQVRQRRTKLWAPGILRSVYVLRKDSPFLWSPREDGGYPSGARTDSPRDLLCDHDYQPTARDATEGHCHNTENRDGRLPPDECARLEVHPAYL